ncbi:MAG: hypothetical protein KTR31_36630 [Myxococcales bacterium]|nr:hypothetical protein [Myxococcales bacterium]
MTALWAVGGRQGRAASVADRDHGGLYAEAVLARVPLAEASARPVLTYRGPGGRGDCFKGVSIDVEGLLVCTEAEVLRVRGGAVQARTSLPSFNDVHHARQLEGSLHVASTGCDGVVVEGRFVAVGDGVVPPSEDVRTADLRPHRWHPNHLFGVEGRAFVTRGMAGDAVALDGSAHWPLSDGVVHDGVVCADGVWFTAVDGRLLRVDPGRGVVDREVRLTELDERSPPLGWCRGLVFTGSVAWVGFSRLRATAARQRLAWVRGALRGRQMASSHPTRITGYDLRTCAKVAEIELPGAGIDAVFGLVEATAPV